MKHIDSDISFEDLVFHLDLKENDTVFISSDIKRLALISKEEGKPLDINGFINNFQKVLTNGTLVIPAYTDGLTTGDTFDYKKSKPTIGAIPNRVFRRKDFIRTEDPLHSVLVWGKHTDETLELYDISTFGPKSIYSFLHEINCVFLFLDIHPQNCFTYVHYVEEKLKVPYRRYKKLNITFKKDDIEEKREVLFYTKKKGVLSNIYALVDEFFNQKAMQRYLYKNIPIDKIDAVSATNIMEDALSKKNYFYTFSLKRYFIELVKQILSRG